MRKLLPFGLALVVPLLLMGADYPALPDGGSLVTSTGATPPADGGGPWVTVDTGHTADWVMTIRCSSRLNSPRVFYRLSADGGTARIDDQLLDVDRTFDLPVSQPRSYPQRFLSLLGEDGGPPSCSLQQQTPPD